MPDPIANLQGQDELPPVTLPAPVRVAQPPTPVPPTQELKGQSAMPPGGPQRVQVLPNTALDAAGLPQLPQVTGQTKAPVLDLNSPEPNAVVSKILAPDVAAGVYQVDKEIEQGQLGIEQAQEVPTIYSPPNLGDVVQGFVKDAAEQQAMLRRQIKDAETRDVASRMLESLRNIPQTQGSSTSPAFDWVNRLLGMSEDGGRSYAGPAVFNKKTGEWEGSAIGGILYALGLPQNTVMGTALDLSHFYRDTEKKMSAVYERLIPPWMRNQISTLAEASRVLSPLASTAKLALDLLPKENRYYDGKSNLVEALRGAQYSFSDESGKGFGIKQNVGVRIGAPKGSKQFGFDFNPTVVAGVALDIAVGDRTDALLNVIGKATKLKKLTDVLTLTPDGTSILKGGKKATPEIPAEGLQLSLPLVVNPKAPAKAKLPKLNVVGTPLQKYKPVKVRPVKAEQLELPIKYIVQGELPLEGVRSLPKKVVPLPPTPTKVGPSVARQLELPFTGESLPAYTRPDVKQLELKLNVESVPKLPEEVVSEPAKYINNDVVKQLELQLDFTPVPATVPLSPGQLELSLGSLPPSVPPPGGLRPSTIVLDEVVKYSPSSFSGKVDLASPSVAPEVLDKIFQHATSNGVNSWIAIDPWLDGTGGTFNKATSTIDVNVKDAQSLAYVYVHELGHSYVSKILGKDRPSLLDETLAQSVAATVLATIDPANRKAIINAQKEFFNSFPSSSAYDITAEELSQIPFILEDSRDFIKTVSSRILDDVLTDTRPRSLRLPQPQLPPRQLKLQFDTMPEALNPAKVARATTKVVEPKVPAIDAIPDVEELRNMSVGELLDLAAKVGDSPLEAAVQKADMLNNFAAGIDTNLYEALDVADTTANIGRQFVGGEDPVKYVPPINPVQVDLPLIPPASRLAYHGTRVQDFSISTSNPLVGASRSELGPGVYLTVDDSIARKAAEAQINVNLPAVEGRSFGSPSVHSVFTSKLKLLDASVVSSNLSKLASQVASGVEGLSVNFSPSASIIDIFDDVSIASDEVASLAFQRGFAAELVKQGYDGVQSGKTISVYNTSGLDTVDATLLYRSFDETETVVEDGVNVKEFVNYGDVDAFAKEVEPSVWDITWRYKDQVYAEETGGASISLSESRKLKKSMSHFLETKPTDVSFTASASGTTEKEILSKLKTYKRYGFQEVETVKQGDNVIVVPSDGVRAAGKEPDLLFVPKNSTLEVELDRLNSAINPDYTASLPTPTPTPTSTSIPAISAYEAAVDRAAVELDSVVQTGGRSQTAITNAAESDARRLAQLTDDVEVLKPQVEAEVLKAVDEAGLMKHPDISPSTLDDRLGTVESKVADVIDRLKIPPKAQDALYKKFEEMPIDEFVQHLVEKHPKTLDDLFDTIADNPDIFKHNPCGF
jgi:hypothetical protein